MRYAWFAIIVLAACGQDPAVATGASTADAHVGLPDVPLGDGPISDATEADAVHADSVADTPPSATAPDVAATPVLPDWLVGSWRDCAGTLILSADGTWTWQDAESACGLGGTAKYAGGMLDLAADPTTCAKPTWVLPGLGVALHADILTLLHTNFQGARLFARGPIERQRWLVTDNQADVARMDLCFTGAGAFYTGKWKSLQGCGFLACGGIVDGMQEVNGAWQFWTHCSGTCACSGLIVATVHTATQLSGTFASATCLNSNFGTFTAKREPSP